jgi:hypothetical protein
MMTTHLPPYDEWAAILEANGAVAHALHKRVGESVVRDARSQVMKAAAEYSSSLRAIAKRACIPLPEESRDSKDVDPPIIMAGHQPVIYHPGILEKIACLQRLSATTQARAINVAIDTDEGDAGRIVWPLVQGDNLSLKAGTVGTPGVLFRSQRVTEASQVAGVFEQAQRDLAASELPDAAQRVERVSRLYQALAHESMVAANTIVRWSESGQGYLEIPLSQLVELPAVRGVIQSIIDDREHFVATYNATLDEYRRAHKIKNPANPFPNMVVEPGLVELPLWRIEGDSRQPLRIASEAFKDSFQASVAPRGSVVTMILRGLCSDLFIHGLGGGKYDQFVDRFAVEYWGAPLPRFVVASATRGLFSERVARYSRARDLRARYKEIISHTERFLGDGTFTVGEETGLRVWTEKRRELLRQLASVSSPEERSRVTHALNDVNRSLRTFIDSSSLSTALSEGVVDDAKLAKWSYREFPFFFFQDTGRAS